MEDNQANEPVAPLREDGAVRIGIAGLGGHGRTIQYACEQAPNLHVTSVFDPNQEEAAAAANHFGCRISHSYEALIREKDIDAIVLVTPNHLHRSQVEAALSNGKDVFVEKPIANTITDGVAMIQKAEADGRVLMVGHNMRFGRAARKASDWIRQGKLGEIVSAEIHFSSDTGLILSKDAWRFKPEFCPLLPVMQLAVHAFDLIHYLIGRIEDVTTYTRSVTTEPGVIDSVTAVLRLEGGALGTMVSNYCTPVLFEYRIAGTEGLLRCTPDTFWFEQRGAGDAGIIEEDFSPYKNESYVRQMEAFGEAVRVQAIPETDGWVGLQALAVVEAMQRSAVNFISQPVQQFESQSLTI